MKRIIIVDDDPAIQDVYFTFLENAGYEVIVYASGQPLLAGDFIPPDIFILDKQIPGADGLDICKWLKRQEKTSHIPVIMMSASPQVAPLAVKAGAVAFLEKPFLLSKLREIVDKWTA